MSHSSCIKDSCFTGIYPREYSMECCLQEPWNAHDSCSMSSESSFHEFSDKISVSHVHNIWWVMQQQSMECCYVTHDCPTQSGMYVPLQVNIFYESILLIVQYKYLKSCSGDFYSPESDPPHKIMRYWFYYSIWLGFSFPQDHAGLVEMICTIVVPVSKRHLGGASP